MFALPAVTPAVLTDPSMITDTSSPSNKESCTHDFAMSEPAMVSDCSSSKTQDDTHFIANNISTGHNALDALAALASGRATLSEDAAVCSPHPTSSDDDDSRISMPPPPPRAALSTTHFTTLDEARLLRDLPLTAPRIGRLRSASNPEGMEKWDSYRTSADRKHFFLPSSILEEELASTKKVMGESHTGVGLSPTVCGFQFTNYSYYDTNKVQEFTMLTPGDNEAISYSTMLRRKKRQIKQPSRYENSECDNVKEVDKTVVKKGSRKKTKSPELINEGNANISEENEDVVDESLLEPEELLRRARSKLLEDLSEENGEGEKGVLSLPHLLSKYKEIYNKNGRIGIYTPAERAAIITKFNAKRARRVWNKKIRYNCRKNLADRRMRIKGRFVKRSIEAIEAPTSSETNESTTSPNLEENQNTSNTKKKGRSTPPTSGSPLCTVDENEAHDDDEEMPDVDDEEAGFSPTDDMPYRRTRRYTIT